jgi:hypothetical protein
LYDGFPPNTFSPTGAPDGRDFNGILNMMSAWNWWQAAGGPVPWDSSFSTAIGGYPKGAVVASATTFGIFWLNSVENNTSNPDAGGAGWTTWTPGLLYGADTGAVNALVVNIPGAPAAPYTGLVIQTTPAHSNTSSAVTLNYNGTGAKNVVRFDGAGLIANNLSVAPSKAVFSFDSVANSWVLLNPNTVTALNFSLVGYYILPGGLILEWGYLPISGFSTDTSFTITFPLAFPNACLSLTGTTENGHDDIFADVFPQVISRGTTTAALIANNTYGSNSNITGFYWVAIGY